MKENQIGKKLLSLRKEKKMTQKEVADFVGVSVAAVSKWEKLQSSPDIITLPKLAALYGISVDELVEYKAQMDEKQIKELCIQLSYEMTEKSFNSAYNKIKNFIKRFYHCYPLVLSFSLLVFRYHYVLEDPEQQKEVLEQAIKWCNHIAKDCNNSIIINNAVSLSNRIEFSLGQHKKITKNLMTLENQKELMYFEEQILIRSFLMLEDYESADYYISELISKSVSCILDCFTLSIHSSILDEEKCQLFFLQAEKLIKKHELKKNNPYLVMQLYYAAALSKAMKQKKDECLDHLEHFAEIGLYLLENPEKYYYDSYFSLHSNIIPEAYHETGLLKIPLNFKSIGYDSMKPDQKQIYFELYDKLKAPVFAFLMKEERFMNMLKEIEFSREMVAFFTQIKRNERERSIQKRTFLLPE